MTKIFSFTHLADHQRIFLANPRIATDKRDDEGYQWFETYDDEYLENKLGGLGIIVSPTVSGIWGLAEEQDVRKMLTDIMRLALPHIDLPISPAQYSAIPSDYFPLVQLLSEGDIFYDEKNHIVHLPAGKNPEDFFKSTLFKGKLDEDSVRKVVLTHGYLEGLNDDLGDFRFLSIDIANKIWPLNPVRVTKAYNSLVDDGLLSPVGGRTSSGFPSFTKIPAATRRIIETIETANETDKPLPSNPSKQNTEIPSYIPDEISKNLTESAKNRGYDISKLKTILSELNDATKRDKAQSSHALIRTLLDHITPLFGYESFSQVANNYGWSSTDKKRIKELQTLFRFDADDSLHSPISSRNTAVDMHSIGLIRRTIIKILEEVSTQT
jgi:hypothetical protein